MIKALLKNTIKMGLIMFAVGLVLGATAPLIAGALGSAGILSSEFAAGIVSHSSLSSTLWNGLYFGGFGALSAAITPVVGMAFGERGDAAAAANPSQPAQDASPQPDLTLAQAQNVSPTHFQDIVTTQKAAAAATHIVPGA